ncbi:hypothetical protein C2G38_2200318 [Gigaspora rosea]|uniref:Uncharacterized protein n=1 Tax=Gigaspora rosea TaxID=44941 RepID=A0A397UTS8_9GLOM|nr:hypothetical protein C2G38_2200318 [Gigaspora rosea]
MYLQLALENSKLNDRIRKRSAEFGPLTKEQTAQMKDLVELQPRPPKTKKSKLAPTSVKKTQKFELTRMLETARNSNLEKRRRQGHLIGKDLDTKYDDKSTSFKNVVFKTKNDDDYKIGAL